MMRHSGVASSNIASVGYDDETETLEIAFRGGSVYRYDGVPVAVYNDLMHASSTGKAFETAIKKAGYTFTRVR